jgi:hypothetical protein
MGVVFEQVEGVVQKAESPTPAADSGADGAGRAKPPHESYDEMRRRMERLMRRLHAD